MLSECAFSVFFFIRVVSERFVVLVALLRVVKECRMVFIYNTHIYIYTIADTNLPEYQKDGRR